VSDPIFTETEDGLDGQPDAEATATNFGLFDEEETENGRVIDSAAKTHYFPERLIFRRRVKEKEAFRKILNGGVVYTARHPIFFAGYYFGAIITFLGAVTLAFLGDNFWIYPTSVISLILFGYYLAQVFMVRTHYIAVSRNVVAIQKGILNPRTTTINVSEFADATLIKPPRGLGWLHYATWKPASTGEHDEIKPIKKVMSMEELQRIIINLKSLPLDEQRKHDEVDTNLQLDQNQLLRQNIAAVEKNGQRLDRIIELLQSRPPVTKRPIEPEPITGPIPLVPLPSPREPEGQ
jgi:hypothetical protein